MSYRIVMDSAGDLQHFDGVEFACVPLKILAGDKTYIDDTRANAGEMTAYLRSYKGKSASACPSIGEYLEAFGQARHVYCITITSNLSGSYNAAKAAAHTYEEAHPDCKVHVFDTLSAGPEMTLLAEKLRELILSGADHESIIAAGEDYLKSTRLLFSLESLHNLAVNGRVPHIVAKATGVLGLRLIGRASEIGTLQPIGKARGEGKVPKEIFRHMVEMGYQGGRVRIHHCQNSVGAQALRDTVLHQFPGSCVVIEETRILCSFYAEQGGMLVGFEV